MAVKHLKRAAKPCSKVSPGRDAWWYEEPQGISVVTSAIAPDGSVMTVTAEIRWSSIRAALRRKDKDE